MRACPPVLVHGTLWGAERCRPRCADCRRVNAERRRRANQRKAEREGRVYRERWARERDWVVELRAGRLA